MFCPECGTKNDDAAKFCENCGTKLDVQETASIEQIDVNVESTSTQNTANVSENNSNQNVQNQIEQQKVQSVTNMQPVQSKPLSKKTKLIIVGVIAAIVAIVIFVNVGKKVTDPENIAIKYFESVANAEWEEVYGYYDLSEDDFINKKMFKKMVKGKDKIEYSNCAVKSETPENLDDVLEEKSSSKKDSDISKIVNIEYAQKNSESTTSQYSVRLVKLSKKKMLFFDNWKVVPEDMLSKDYYIATLNGIDVYMDGKKLTKKYISKEKSSSSYEKNLVRYKIPALFQGDHKIKLKGEYIDTYEEEISLGRASNDSFVYTNPKIKQSFIEELRDSTEKIVEELYTDAVDGKKFEEIKLPYEVYKDKEEDIVTSYKTLCESVENTSYSNSIKLKKIKKKDFEVTNENTFIDEGSVSATIAYKLTYEGEFVKKKGDKDEKKKDDDETRGTISYKYIDGNWVVSNIYTSKIYYYWY